ncbi:hypothetical protein F441_08992, partial [Phytophthora nicotianae CJ01A1]
MEIEVTEIEVVVVRHQFDHQMDVGNTCITFEMAATNTKAKAPTGRGSIATRRCSTCKKVFASQYSKTRHLKKKFGCSKTAKKKRVAERKERRKSQNKAYYLRRKWGISLTHDPLSKILDTLLSKIPDAKVSGLPAKRLLYWVKTVYDPRVPNHEE